MYDLESDEAIRLAEANGKPKLVEVVQEAGQTVFVPSGWHHQVKQELETLRTIETKASTLLD